MFPNPQKRAHTGSEQIKKTAETVFLSLEAVTDTPHKAACKVLYIFFIGESSCDSTGDFNKQVFSDYPFSANTKADAYSGSCLFYISWSTGR